MATKYVVAAGGNSNASGTWSNVSSASAGGDGVPTAADDVVLDAGSGNLTVNATLAARSIDCTGYTGTWTSSTQTINIGDGTAGAGNIALKFVSGMTTSISAFGNINFISTSGTQQTIDTGGKTLGRVTINGSGSSYLFVSNMTLSNVWTHTTGTIDMTTNSVVLTVLNGVGSGNFNGNGQTYYSVDIATSIATINGANTFTNLEFTNGNAGANILTLAANQTVTGELKVQGSSSYRRQQVVSDVRGTQRTITNTGATMTLANMGFRDIALSDSYDATAISGNCDDFGGNSNITFLAGTTLYWYTTTTGTKDWNTTGFWFLGTGGSGGAGRVPLAQDNAVFDANSIGAASTTVNLNFFSSSVGSITWTGVTNNPIWAGGSYLYILGNITLDANMTSTGTFTLEFIGSSTQTLTTNGVSIDNPIIINKPSGVALQLGSAVTTGATRTVTLTSGTFDMAGYDLSTGFFSTTNSNTRTLTLGSGTLSLTGTSASTVFNAGTSTNLTVTATTGTIKFTGTGNNAQTFAGGGKTYGNLWFSRGTSTGSLTVAGSNTFTDFKDDGSAAHSILFGTGTTTTVTTWTVSGSAGNLITIDSVGGSTDHNLVKVGGGVISSDYLDIQNSDARPWSGDSGVDTWYAGANSQNDQVASGGTGWIFTAAPGGDVVSVATLLLIGVG